MLVGEIIALCIIFLALPPVVWRLIYLTHKTKYEKFMAQVDALNKLKATLNSTLNSMGGSSSAPTAELIKKIKVKKSKILDKLDALIELISSRTGIPIVCKNITDTYLQEQITVKGLPETAHTMPGVFAVDYNFMKQIVHQLIEENKFPTEDDYNYINEIYKKFKKMKKVKK